MLVPRVGVPASHASLPEGRTAALAPSQRAILYAVLYGEVFDYPLTAEEVLQYRPRVAGADSVSRDDVDELVGDILDSCEGYVFWRGREHLVAERARRGELAKPLWRVAQRFAGWLRHVPFVRMVAVCGSLAMGNTGRNGDVDIFIVAADRRVWIVHTFAMVFRRLIATGGVKVCPNYFLSRGSLEARPMNMFVAREVVQTVPLWGSSVYDEFLAANPWVEEVLPAHDSRDRRGRLADRDPPTIQRVLERLLDGRLGDRLDLSLHLFLLHYFKRRWSRHDSGGRGVKSAYRRDRQEVVGGGYGLAVRHAFERLVAERIGLSPEIEADLQELFPVADSAELSPEGPAPHFEKLFADRYGRSG